MNPINKNLTRNIRHERLVHTVAPFSAALLLLLLTSSLCSAASPGACFSTLAGNDAAALAGPTGHILYAINEKKPRIPASTLKILTALTVLRSFEPSHRFPTMLFIGKDRCLYVKGFGDPLLTSEALLEMAEAVSVKTRSVEQIVVDHSYFSEVTIPGVNYSSKPYDAPLGALSANFNTVKIAPGPGGKLVSAEDQTPLIQYAKARLERLGANHSGRYTFIHDAAEAANYTGELLSHFLKLNGVAIAGGVKSGNVPPDAELLMTFLSPWTIEEAVERMLEFSNNFVANQLFLAAGARQFGAPGSLEKSLQAAKKLAVEVFGLTSLEIVEGSGISRENRISASDMLLLLRHFSPYRYMLKQEFGITYKTGTLRGIRTRAGYLEPEPGKPHPFVLFINENIENTDKIIKCLGRNTAALIKSETTH
ncbi:MAG TPA: hypothetical protein ENN79_15890 [Desulfobacteraceae bacterium]|nr:hypothetical protein [Desulfobacteraceae bacterium]